MAKIFNNNNNMQSRIEFNSFFSLINNTKSPLCRTITATVIYTTDGIENTFTNQSVTLKSEPSGPGIVDLDNIDTDEYHTGFNTDFQTFKCNKNQLEISGKGAGNKSFSTYTVIIIPD
ncbi:MAG TPA: hypothetical protein DCZ76_07600 [Treponema sp.]|nr:hypothetical protein [Treponema sp.]